jgi:hypothetical protein
MSILNNAILSVKEFNRLQNYVNAPDIQFLRKQAAVQFPTVLKVFRSIDADINEKNNRRDITLLSAPIRRAVSFTMSAIFIKVKLFHQCGIRAPA